METFVKKAKHVDELHFEHQLWLAEMRFYNDELKVYQKYLDHIAMRKTSSDERKHIEHFQNVFIIHKEQLDILKHDINIHEQWLSRYAAKHPDTINDEVFSDHQMMRERVTSFRHLYKELKSEFIQFSSSLI